MINWWSTERLVPSAVFIGFPLVFLAKTHSEQLFTVRLRARGAVCFQGDRNVGTLFCPASRRPAVRPAPCRPDPPIVCPGFGLDRFGLNRISVVRALTKCLSDHFWISWKLRGSLGSWANSSVGTESCPTPSHRLAAPPPRPALRPDPIRLCYNRVLDSTGWRALMLPGKRKILSFLNNFLFVPKASFRSPVLLSVSCAPFGLCSGSAPASERPLGIFCAFVGPVSHLGSTRIPLRDLLLQLSPIRASLAADPEVVLHHHYLEGTVLVAAWFLQKNLLGRTLSGSRPKRFFKGVTHQHRTLMLAVSCPFLSPVRCSLGAPVHRLHLAATLRTMRFCGIATFIGRWLKASRTMCLKWSVFTTAMFLDT